MGSKDISERMSYGAGAMSHRITKEKTVIEKSAVDTGGKFYGRI